MLEKVTISGFKSIYSQEIELGRVNCFIGANGVGKSNVLEAIGLLGAAAYGIVDDESIVRRGVRAGVPRLYKSSFTKAKRAPGHIGLTAQGHDGAIYKVSLLNPLDAPKPAWEFKTEVLSDNISDVISKGVRSQKKNLEPTQGLAALKLIDLEENRPAAVLMQALKQYAIYSPSTPTLRSVISDPQSRSPVGLNGGQLAESFQMLLAQLGKNESGEETLDEMYELIDWVMEIKASAHVSALISHTVPRTQQALKFTDKFMQKNRNELTAYDASEGALYVLFCAVLCLLDDAPKVFAIDNLDQALNPRLVSKLTSRLAGWLKRRDENCQILFTAHNPAVLDGLDLTDPEIRLFAVERNSYGMTEIRRITISNQLIGLAEKFPLSRLWLMGHMGAVPNV